MKTSVLFAFPANEVLCDSLCRLLAWEAGELQMRRFPDGESYLRFLTPVHKRDVVFVCTLDRPDDKLVALYLAAKIARDQGASRVGLVAPYLAYMRQDTVFHEGEGVTSKHVAALLGSAVDWIVTVDPHLHRYHDLNEIYGIPTQVVHAAPEISKWIHRHVTQPIVIGPDAESEQWVAEVAKGAGCPYTVLQKIRRGDREVEVSIPDTSRWQNHTPVLVDDIASTARTLIAAVGHLDTAHLPAPICIVVHPIFAGDAFLSLQRAGVAAVISCNTISHASVSIDLSETLASAIRIITA